jgi:hypothetical protein
LVNLESSANREEGMAHCLDSNFGGERAGPISIGKQRGVSLHTQTGAPIPPAEKAQVERLLAQHNSKSALELTKTLNKRCGTAESEELLIRAYCARISGLLEKDMRTEAEALLALVCDRYPRSRPTLTGLKAALAARRGEVGELLRRLADAQAPAEERAGIETALLEQLRDPFQLLQATVLPPGHRLRQAAAALCEAFTAVTERPVSDAEVRLPEVSRHSPLAPWKALVRAIACFYRREDETCERHLAAIDPRSPAARLAPAMRSMLGRQPDAKLEPAAVSLLTAVGGDSSRLRQALLSLETAFSRPQSAKIGEEIRGACRTCEMVAPVLLARLQQTIFARAYVARVRAQEVGGGLRSVRKDANFWRLFATAVERTQSGGAAQLFRLWDEFRIHAIHEGWFPPAGPEVAAVYLHLADVLARFSSEDLQEELESLAEGETAFDYSGQPPSIREAAAKARRLDPAECFFPQQLYARACALDPHTEAFERWLACAKRLPDWHTADEAANAWRRASPSDVRPLLFLMQAAEERDALRKAVSYLEMAESLDQLNPEVRRARLRLLVAEAVRHLRQNKPHLLERDLAGIATLPQVQERDRPAIPAVLAWGRHVLENDSGRAAPHFRELARVVQSEAAALLICGALARACGLPPWESTAPLLAFSGCHDAPELVEAAARACALCHEMQLGFGIPPDLEQALLARLSQGKELAPPEQLATLGEAALAGGKTELAYALAGAGLARPGPLEARFLLLRGRSMLSAARRRAIGCIAAAAELARCQHDTAVVGQAIEALRILGLSPESRALSVTPAQLQNVLEEERKSRAFPDLRLEPPGEDDELCDCPACRARRALGIDLVGDTRAAAEAAFDRLAELLEMEQDDRGAPLPRPRPRRRQRADDNLDLPF